MVPIQDLVWDADPWNLQELTSILGNLYYDQINSDKLAPPGTDNGQTINAQWPMGELSASRDGPLLTMCRTQPQPVSRRRCLPENATNEAGWV